MKESRIIEILKQNRTNGIGFDFLPADVQKWCLNHREDILIYEDGVWEDDINPVYEYRYTDVFCLPEEYSGSEKQSDKRKYYVIVKAFMSYKPVIIEASSMEQALEIVGNDQENLEIDPEEIEITWEDVEIVSEKEDLFDYYQKTVPAKYLKMKRNKEVD